MANQRIPTQEEIVKVTGIKDLTKIIALCRKQGVVAIEVDGVKLSLGPDPKPRPTPIDLNAFPEAAVRIPQYSPIQAQDTANEPIDIAIDMPDELTEEQLMFYSAKAEVQ